MTERDFTFWEAETEDWKVESGQLEIGSSIKIAKSLIVSNLAVLMEDPTLTHILPYGQNDNLKNKVFQFD